MDDQVKDERQKSKRKRRMAAAIEHVNIACEVEMSSRGMNPPKSAVINSSQKEKQEEILPHLHGRGYQESGYEEDEQPYFESSAEEHVDARKRYPSYRWIDDQKVEVYNPTLEPEYIKTLICAVCETLRTETEEEDSFIICENRRCLFRGGGHYDCLGFSEAPAGQWFCDKCKKTCKCSQCDVKLQPDDILVSCDWCNAFGHAHCLRPPFELLDIIRSQDWRCVLCLCILCGNHVVPEDPMLQCTSCRENVHSSCLSISYDKYNIEPRVTGFECVCITCFAKTVSLSGPRGFGHLGESDFQDLPSADAFDEENSDSSSDSEASIDDVDDDDAMDGPTTQVSFHTRNIASLSSIFWRKPLLYFALSQYIGHGVSPFAREEDWRCMARVLCWIKPGMSEGEVERLRPPQKQNRVLDSEVPIKIHKQLLTCEFKRVKISADCVYRDLKEVVEQMLVSPVNLRNVPLHKIGNDCEARSRWGPRLVEVAEEFRRTKKLARQISFLRSSSPPMGSQQILLIYTP